MRTISDINRKLARAGCPVTLYRGAGYLYFVYDHEQAGVWEDRTIPCCYFNQMPPAWWLAEGEQFATAVRANKGDESSDKNC